MRALQFEIELAIRQKHPDSQRGASLRIALCASELHVYCPSSDHHEQHTTRSLLSKNEQDIIARRMIIARHLSVSSPDLGPLFLDMRIIRRPSRDGRSFGNLRETSCPTVSRAVSREPVPSSTPAPRVRLTLAQRMRRRAVRIDRLPYHISRVYQTPDRLPPRLSVQLDSTQENLDAQLTVGPKSCPPRLRSLLPPGNFGTLSPAAISRSALPKDENVPFLISLKIRTLVTLTDDQPTGSFHGWLKLYGLAHHQIDLGKNKPGHAGVSLDVMCEVLLLLLNSNNWPLHVHCNQGKHRTGCVVACFRKVQDVAFQSCGKKGIGMDEIVGEYVTYAGKKARDGDIEFIRNFDPGAVFDFAIRHHRFKGLLSGQRRQCDLGWEAQPPIASDVGTLAMVLLRSDAAWDVVKEVSRPVVMDVERPCRTGEGITSRTVRSPAGMGPCAG